MVDLQALIEGLKNRTIWGLHSGSVGDGVLTVVDANDPGFVFMPLFLSDADARLKCVEMKDQSKAEIQPTAISAYCLARRMCVMAGEDADPEGPSIAVLVAAGGDMAVEVSIAPLGDARCIPQDGEPTEVPDSIRMSFVLGRILQAVHGDGTLDSVSMEDLFKATLTWLEDENTYLAQKRICTLVCDDASCPSHLHWNPNSIQGGPTEVC